MIIDEGFSCMDENNLSNMQTLFDKLKEIFKYVIIISHIDDLKNKCDQYMYI